MGGGSWSGATYASVNAMRSSTGKSDFDYSDTTTRTTPPSSWKTHADLDPKGVAFRESRDSDEHPDSVAIAVLFDVTGSMSGVPRQLVKKLPDLFGLLLRKGYVEHPQILMGAIGDATCDRTPLQVGQFESDNRVDDNLANILLEGGGGGQTTESYELAAYFMSRHTAIDCYEKRGHRGYLFIIGDESPYNRVKPNEVSTVLGETLEQAIDTQAIFDELSEKWDVYLIRPGGATYRPGEATGDSIIEGWRKILGPQHVIDLEDADNVCETIALTIGLGEDAIDLDEGLGHLEEIGSDAGASVGKALAHIGGSGSVATGDAPADL